ncbi:hypothetical protein [Streptomyces gobiensis]|uniref:hypothetical protein n=1 Tax=Streptomyces gobiensis TaxID=2875706 RepID=UPI001E651E8F|nr:hypothetical protein [Streptomyces gobiensis]UGY91009.1 hypothetical protein test1122_04220 [Streptomyces gobiensis]
MSCLCGAQRPAWHDMPPPAASRFSCVGQRGHDGLHRDFLGEGWIDPDSELAQDLALVIAADQLRALCGWGDDQ